MNKRYYLTLFAVLTFRTLLFSQSFEWVHSNPVHYSLNPGLSTYSVCTSSSGKIFASRLDSSTLYFGSIYGVQKIDCYDYAQQLQWSYEAGQKAIIERVASDPNGNLYAAGEFTDNLLLGDNDSLENSTGVNLNVDIFLFSLDPSGALRWKKNITVEHPGSTYFSCIRCDKQGNCWYGISDFSSSKIIRVDDSGQDVQTIDITGSRSLGSFDFDEQQNLFATGSTEGGFTLSAGGLSVNVNDSYMMYVLRINSSGQGSWIHLAHDVTFNQPSIICDPWSGAYLGGTLMDSTSFGTTHFNGPQWVYDAFLTHVDSSGNFSWGIEVPHTATIEGDFEKGSNNFLDVDASGNVYMTGITRGHVDWGNGVVTGIGMPVQTSISILSFDTNGIPRWSLDGYSNHFNSSYALAVDQQGDCFFGSAVNDTAFFGTFSVNEGGGLAFVLGKISTPAPASVNDIRNETHANIFPNPAKDKVYIELNYTAGFFELHDITGKLLQENFIQFSKYELDMSHFGSGVYFLTVGDKNIQQHIKILKE